MNADTLSMLEHFAAATVEMPGNSEEQADTAMRVQLDCLGLSTPDEIGGFAAGTANASARVELLFQMTGCPHVGGLGQSLAIMAILAARRWKQAVDNAAH